MHASSDGVMAVVISMSYVSAAVDGRCDSMRTEGVTSTVDRRPVHDTRFTLHYFPACRGNTQQRPAEGILLIVSAGLCIW